LRVLVINRPLPLIREVQNLLAECKVL
jgi:hypothetical protein